MKFRRAEAKTVTNFSHELYTSYCLHLSEKFKFSFFFKFCLFQTAKILDQTNSDSRQLYFIYCETKIDFFFVFNCVPIFSHVPYIFLFIHFTSFYNNSDSNSQRHDKTKTSG